MAEELKTPDPSRHADEAPDTEPALDEASASLADALRTSFRVLTFIILLLLALFVAQGFFTVQSDMKAIILRFGAYEEGRVKDQGIHFAFPYPIDRVVPIWVKTRNLSVNTFWKKTAEKAKDENLEKGKEAPASVEGAQDAYMLTGDLNILWGQWDVTYRIRSDNQAVVDYYLKIGEGTAGETADAARRNWIPEKEKQLVRSALESAAIREAGAMKVFAIYPRDKADVLVEAVKTSLQQTLRRLDCGLEVDRVTVRELRPPDEVKAAFDDVLTATQEMEALRINTKSAREKTLIETVGAVGIPNESEKRNGLGDDIEKWWAARNAGGDAERQKVEADMSDLFSKAGGQVQTMLAEARTYGTQVVESARGDSANMEYLLKNPDQVRVFLDHARVDALQEVLSACYEKYFYNRASDKGGRLLELWLSRRPELIRAQMKPETTH